MKAILVIDMPSNCLDCPCEYDYMRCKATYYKLDYVNANTERPSWCPLRPLPQKLKLRIQREWITDYDRYEIGYNACLDKIAGEAE